MKLKIWKPTISEGVVKATIHRSGKLGFSKPAIEKISITDNTYIKIATNAENSKDDSLYILISQESDENSIKVKRAGEYYYLNTKDFFNHLGVDYRNKTIIYDIIETELEGEKMYKLIRREMDRK